LRILDIGCGGGLVCEPFARLGHNVTGIDQSREAIEIAQQHALEQGLNIHYKCDSIDNISETYDVITILEVLEHVENPLQLLEAAVAHLAPNGLIFFSTLNRTLFSYVAGIWLAENVLKWAPKGTHNWSQFLKPSEVALPLQQLGINLLDISGINWSILKRRWEIATTLKGNYIGVGQRS
jgi:2-polyprenyl-6-hydroxyphenyl methylase/3-demethylubiquinone-9 3-methyltransferase